MLAGVLLLTPPAPRTLARIATAGVLLGIAVVMKQHAAAFVAFGGLWLLATGPRANGWSRTVRECLVFAAAALVPYAVVWLVMWRAGAAAELWFWTVTYARDYAGMIPSTPARHSSSGRWGDLVRTAPAFWLLVAVGATTPWWDAPARRAAAFVGWFALCSLAAVCPGCASASTTSSCCCRPRACSRAPR